MIPKHLILILFIMMVFGSAYPLGKLALNDSIPPILLASLRMGIVFLCLIPFWKFKLPSKKYYFTLTGFSLCMGVAVFMFMNLALENSSLVSPIIIGSQMAIPFGIICSSFFLNEKISIKKWIFVFTSLCGIILIGFDPNMLNEIYGLMLAVIMAFFYGLSQVISRYLKSLPVSLLNAYMSLTGFVVLSSLSLWLEGNIWINLQNINWQTWMLIFHSALVVSLFAHISMFYLYKFYPVGKVLPFYTLFPIFGIIQTFFIFEEIPTPMVVFGGLIVICSVYIINQIKI